ncbi:MAG: hypothetical protein FWD49_02905 [Firmicutes bacterium]|nr:hypothetical protein [Bacillota bacterium]
MGRICITVGATHGKGDTEKHKPLPSCRGMREGVYLIGAHFLAVPWVSPTVMHISPLWGSFSAHSAQCTAHSEGNKTKYSKSH